MPSTRAERGARIALTLNSPRRIAVLAFNLESNAWAPVVGRKQFEESVYLVGDEIAADLATSNPRCLAEIRGFVDRMDQRGAWEPVYLIVASRGGAGRVDQAFFDAFVASTQQGLSAAGRVDAVYIAGHGAAVATEDPDPDATLFEAVRNSVGMFTPIVATIDLHALVSARMVAATDLLCAYLTNPHVDQYERGAEAADAMLEILGGQDTASAFVRVPLLPPQTALLTSHGPYADVVKLGQTMLGPKVLNVSICGNFSYADSPRNGIGVVVTTRGDQSGADATALALATCIWSDRQQYLARLTPLGEALRRMRRVADDPTLPALAFADVSDNPGGGALGNTTYLLRAFHEARFQDVALGVFTDPDLAAEAHERGVGARFEAVFNRRPANEFAETFRAPAEVMALSDGVMVGRRGSVAGRTLTLGPSARLRLGGLDVVVISFREQLFDPVQLEHFGIDIAALRGLIVKSRGHFRAGFDETFGDTQILEVDVPGPVTPILTRIPFKNLVRPMFPFDPDMSWTPRIDGRGPASA